MPLHSVIYMVGFLSRMHYFVTSIFVEVGQGGAVFDCLICKTFSLRHFCPQLSPNNRILLRTFFYLNQLVVQYLETIQLKAGFRTGVA